MSLIFLFKIASSEGMLWSWAYFENELLWWYV